MIKNLTQFLKHRMVQASVLLFFIITVWWLNVRPFSSEVFVSQKNIWSAIYMFMSILGGIFGLIISKYWGGSKSLIGRAILCFSIGLFLQSFGQLVYNYYTLFKNIETPYPSLGDLGYFGSILTYIYGVWLLGCAVGLKISSKTSRNQVLIVAFPLTMLIFSYFIFLKNYVFNWSHPLTIFLDFGYPLGQALYVSLAILVLFISRKFLGGIMKKPVLLLLFALIVQYVCDFNFLYQANNNNWYAGNLGDYLYAVSYFIMTIAIIYIGATFNKIKEAK
ncbi:MAG: hypothetical protein WAN61_03255 [Minisyncoccia bacterium]